MNKVKPNKISSNIMQAWKPPDDISIVDWAEKNIILSSLTCPEPGPIRLSRTPYTRGVLEAFQSPFIDWIVLCWGRQVGKTQGVEMIALCYAIDQDPGPALMLFPSGDLAEYTSTNRLQPMIEASPAMCRKKTRNRDEFTTMEMKFVDMVLSLAGGGSGTQVMSRPVRYLFRDEIDELKKGVGQDATDPLKASEQTTSNYGNRKIIDSSTPTNTDGNVWLGLKSCQYIFEFWVPCPSCGAKQILTWMQVKWPKGEHDSDAASLLAHYECEFCQWIIRDRDKPVMLAGGEWRARLTGDVTKQLMDLIPGRIQETISLGEVLADHSTRKIGFHLPKWYSSFPNSTFGQATKEFLEAQGDFFKLRDWRKIWQALPWEENILKFEVAILANKVDIPATIIPENTVALTAGIDPGQGGFWVAVYAWVRNDPKNRAIHSLHLVQYGFFPGWPEIHELIFNYTYQSKDGRTLRIFRAGIDTGGSEYEGESRSMTEDAYNFIRRCASNRVVGTKGASSPRRANRMWLSVIDKMPGHGQVIPGGLSVWMLDSGAFKDALHYRLQKPKGDPGGITFHSETGDDFARHILAEKKRRNKKGEIEWVQLHKDNHWLDCTAIALSLGDAECWGGMRILSLGDQSPRIKEQVMAVPPAEIMRDRQYLRPGWLDRG